MLASFLSSWIRFGLVLNTFYVYSLAVAVTLIVYPSTLYVFDLYNLEDIPFVGDAAFPQQPHRCFRYNHIHGSFLPSARALWKRHNGDPGELDWLFLNALGGGLTGPFSNIRNREIPDLGPGAGIGKAIYDLLKSPFSPYEVRGFSR